jgi:hypothetical protein
VLDLVFCIGEDRKTESHGGVFILVSDKYLSSEPTDLKSDDSSEQLAIKIKRCISECIVTIYTCDG